MIRISTLVICVVLCLGAYTQTSAQSQVTAATNTISHSGEFVKKRYSVKGQWTLANIDGRQTISFSEDFKTKNGPDLKVYLSPKSLEDVTRKTATDGSVKIGVLKSSTGEQSYVVPDDVNLSDYKSLLVHCEAYSVLWGGFDIPQ